MIKAISFDLWGTLIKSSPSFKEARAQWLNHNSGVDVNTINDTIYNIKHSFDQNVSKFGIHYSSDFLFRTVIKELSIKNVQPDQFKFVSNRLFVEHGAQLFDKNTEPCIKKLAQHFDLHIISNTLMVDGTIIRIFLNKIGLLQYFKSTTFSSDIGKSKPNKIIFKCAHQKMDLMKESIIHIGDNPICDIKGAESYGFKSCLINNQESILEISKELINGNY